VSSSAWNNCSVAALNDGRRCLGARNFVGTAASSVGEDRGRPDTLRRWRPGIKVEFADKAGHGQPRVALNAYGRVGAQALAPSYRQALPCDLLARLLAPVPGFASELQKSQVVLFEPVAVDRDFPPLPRGWR
jgi:hypothetical protein